MRSRAQEGVKVNLILLQPADQDYEVIRQLRIKLHALESSDFVQRGLNRPGNLVWAFVSERIEHVCERSDSSRQGNSRTRNVTRIAGSVPPLVVIASDFLGHLH